VLRGRPPRVAGDVHQRGQPRAGGGGTHAGLAHEPGVRLGGVAGGLLMAVVDDVDSLLDAPVVEREQVPATEREQVSLDVE
jgi:hypothetical protein